MNLKELEDKMFVRTIYWENIYHCHLLKITTYRNRIKPNRVRDYVWCNNWGMRPKYSEITIQYLDSRLKYLM